MTQSQTILMMNLKLDLALRTGITPSGNPTGLFEMLKGKQFTMYGGLKVQNEITIGDESTSASSGKLIAGGGFSFQTITGSGVAPTVMFEIIKGNNFTINGGLNVSGGSINMNEINANEIKISNSSNYGHKLGKSF